MAKKESTDPMDLGITIPDIPMPAEQAEDKDVVEDECDAAFDFAFIGTGQAGGRLAESFYKMGYRRVCAVNTNNQDLAHINIPEKNKLVMDIGEGGAGKDPAKGALAIKKFYEDVYDLMRRCFGKKFDRIMVLSGLGGGSGTGSIETIIKIAHDIAQSFKLEKPGVPGGTQTTVSGQPAVGALVSLPMTSEGQRVSANAVPALESLYAMVGRDKGKLSARSLSPLILVDNERIQKIYPDLSVEQFWGVANQSIAGLFHLFNSIATKDSEFTTFDRADLNTLLSSGVITFGATPLPKFGSPTDISFAIRDNLRKNILVADIDLGQASAAACVFIGHPEVLGKIPQGNLEHGFEMLTRIMQDASVVHRGIYRGNVFDAAKKPGLVVYTILGELGRPDERMDEVYRIAGMQPKR
jgi:cell division GTPase FtsZ